MRLLFSCIRSFRYYNCKYKTTDSTHITHE